MGIKRDGQGRRGRAARRGISIESLERRDLLAAAAETFTGPSLAGLIKQAQHGKNTAPAQVNLMTSALRTQLENGPLRDFQAGASGNTLVAEAQALEASYEVNVDQQLAGKFPDIDLLLKLQGESVVASLAAANQQAAVGLISPATQLAASKAAISGLTTGPISAYATRPGAITAATQALGSELAGLSNGLSNRSLTLAQVQTTLAAEAEAYRGQVHAGIQRTQLAISGHADDAINALEATVNQIAGTNPSDASTQLATAINTFDTTVIGTHGLFATHGTLARARTPRLKTGQTNGQLASVLTHVSGIATTGGTAALSATLVESDGSPIGGRAVAFTVDGAFAGVALTNFVGVATLTGATAPTAVGTDVQGIVASFLGETNDLPALASGNLTVQRTAVGLGGVTGSATFGGLATLSATLTGPATAQGLAGRLVTFTVDGVTAGSAITNANGVATVTGVPTANPGGIDANGVFATYAGSATEAGASANGNLIVKAAPAVLTRVSAQAPVGGAATLSATLLNATGGPASGQTVTFSLDGVTAGTAISNASGLATLTGVETVRSLGTYPNVAIAGFGGSANYLTTAPVFGNFVVGQAGSNLINVSGSATFGGSATISASLVSAISSQPIAGSTVSFTLDGKAVGTAVTDANGLASLPNVATTRGVGVDTSGIVATFAGNTTQSPTTTSGNLTVLQAATTIANILGSATFGGPATLKATLTSQVTNLPIAGQTVTFTLNNRSVGTAVTDANGLATLTAVPENNAVGTLPGVVSARFAGTANYLATSAVTGSLVVSQAATTLTNVAATTTFGATPKLTATLKSSVTGLGIQGETVQFKLAGATVGSAITDTNGVASLVAGTTTQGVGTVTGDVVASFNGDSSYMNVPAASGDLIVGQAPTKLNSVSGTAPAGGPASLTATLISTITNLPISGQTLKFSLDGTAVGTAITNSQGVAILTGVPTTDPFGVHAGAVVTSYLGAADYVASNSTGDLTVSAG